MTRRRTLARAVFRIALRTLKWGTLAAALLVAGVWAGGRKTACFAFQRVGDYEVFFWPAPGGVMICLQPRMIAGLEMNPGLQEFCNFNNGYPNGAKRIWLPSVKEMPGSIRYFDIPFWLPILLFASISGGLFWRDRRVSRRAKAGECPSCGYSRAGLALDAVCPECGKPKA